ncbi:MAG: DMT family transporter [Prevotellaceae bacterium]|nr:DMT family transporter [Prevotellaceae bacterium]
MDNKKPLLAHLSMFLACAFWGLMAPVGKDAMTHGLTGIHMVTFRVAGAAILFWFASFFVKKENPPLRDILLLGLAGLFGLVLNQCCYTIGLSITSPINSSIVTTSMPIFAMILSAIILKEPITAKKAGGVFMGFSGALMLILTSATADNSKVGDIRGDLLCMFAQLSFAFYLSMFNRLIKRYSVFTVNKWMFTFAALVITPFTYSDIAAIPFASITLRTWLETAFVVVVCTFFCYILTMQAQQVLRPTVVSVYNYVQPLVAVIVSVLTGLGVFKPTHALAVLLVFFGVRFVTKSKSRKDMEKAKCN